MSRLFVVPLLAALLGSGLFAQGGLIRVPQDHPTIQAGIDAASNGDTVLVVDGTYFVNLVLKKKIVLGSLFIVDKHPSHIANTILDGSTPRHPDSASVILVTTGTDTNTVVSGFTIQRGRGTRFYFAPAYWRGGGGIAVFGGGARISHNIVKNDTLATADGVYGGGIAIDPHDGPLSYWIIEHNQILNNVISTSASATVGAEGAGVWLTEDGRFSENVVAGNSAAATTSYATAGGVNIIGATGHGSSTILFSNNLIRNNSSKWGGGVSMYVDPTLTAIPSIYFVNNLIIGNSASLLGSAFHCNSGNYSLVNNTITANVGPSAFQLGASRGPLSVRFLNSIVWNPASTVEFNSTANVTGAASDVRGGLVGTGNINSDPLFISSHVDSLGWFRFNSPTVNAGVISATVGGVLLTAPTTDYYGRARWGTAPDIGAFEDGPWSGTEDLLNDAPTAYALEQNYPNPFNPETRIGYRMRENGWVRLSVANVLGQEVAVLVDEEKEAGYHEAVFGRRSTVDRLPSGIYFYRISVSSVNGLPAAAKAGQRYEATKRMIMIK